MPLVTIGITCYNAADTILRALRSALSQDWPKLEVIIVDDCSRDDSAEIVDRAVAGTSHARLIRHASNMGTAAARNTILDRARGDFVAFFDDDDESSPGRVRVQYERLHAYESVSASKLIACYASGVRRYPNGYEIHVEGIGSRPIVPKGEVVADYLLFNRRSAGVCYGGGTPTCALMGRLSTYATLGGFDSSFRRVEDVDFSVRLALAGGHFIGCPEELYLQHATAAPDKTPDRNLQAELQLVEKHADYLRTKGRYGYARAWFTIRYYHFSGQRLKFLAALASFLCAYPISGGNHLLRSAPSRWRHERRMRRSLETAN